MLVGRNNLTRRQIPDNINPFVRQNSLGSQTISIRTNPYGNAHFVRLALTRMLALRFLLAEPNEFRVRVSLPPSGLRSSGIYWRKQASLHAVASA